MLALNALFQPLPFANRYWVGYSGGMDSHVLLDICVTWWQQGLIPKPQPVFIHHHLSPNADAWAQHCEVISKTYGLTCRIIHVDATPCADESPEEAARRARYTAFADLLARDELLLIAHHQRDQAETFLLQLLRGAGVKGLAAMPFQRALGQGLLARPLLNCSYEDIVTYAKQRQLQWIEDESNTNLALQRNLIRHTFLPLIEKHFASAPAVISRSAQHCATADQLLTELAEIDYQQIKDGCEHTLSISKLATLSLIRRDNVLRYWLYQHHIIPSSTQLAEFQQLLFAKADANPQIKWPGVIIRRYRDILTLLPCQTIPAILKDIVLWDIAEQANLLLPYNLGVLQVTKTIGLGLSAAKLAGCSITIRFRQGGERCQPAGRIGSHPLKKCFQEAGVPPWQRNTIPLLYVNDTLTAVIGYWICEGFAAGLGEAGLLVALHM